MRRILLNMQNNLFSDALASALQSDEYDFEVYKAEMPEDVIDMCSYVRPFAVLMEVDEASPWLLSDRLRLCTGIKDKAEDARLVLIVDEKKDAALAGAVRKAKKDGLIDQFIYCSSSSSYMTAVIDTL